MHSPIHVINLFPFCINIIALLLSAHLCTSFYLFPFTNNCYFGSLLVYLVVFLLLLLLLKVSFWPSHRFGINFQIQTSKYVNQELWLRIRLIFILRQCWLWWHPCVSTNGLVNAASISPINLKELNPIPSVDKTEKV